MTLVIMAAGMGSRFGGLKQIEPINEFGEFIIDYSIYDAIKAGFDKVVFIIKKENYDIFKDTIGKRVENYIQVDYVFQDASNIKEIPSNRVKPLGTAHAILCCKDTVKENFAIINSDDFYGRDAFIKIGTFLKENKDESKYAMAGYKAINTITENGEVKRGICQVKDNYLVNLIESIISKEGDSLKAVSLENGERINITNTSRVSMNMFAFTPKLFEYLEVGLKKFIEKNKDNLETCEYLIPDVIYDLIEKNLISVKVLETSSVWLGMTYKEDKEEVSYSIKKLTESGTYPQKLWNN